MPQLTGTSQDADLDYAQMPYARSWIDHLTEWITRVPGPSWGFYAAALVVLAISNNVAFWIDGSQPVGSFELDKASDAVFSLIFLALYHYLSRVAGQSFDDFKPAIKRPEVDLQILHYRLTNLPAWIGWLTLVAGTVLAVSNVLLNPLTFTGLDKAFTFLPVIYQSAAFSLTLITILPFVIQLLRQLRLVIELHGQADTVDMFHLRPFHAFARFTARAGAVLLLFVLYAGLITALSGPGVPISVMIGICILAICIFFIPLLGIQHRLGREKAQLLDETNEAIKVTMGRIHGEVTADTYEKMPVLNNTMTSLVAERTLIKSLSTLPWDTATLRGFATTLLLPVLLWLVTRILGRFI
jgi:hypothetical protein